MAAAVGQAARIVLWGPASDSAHPDFVHLSEQFWQARRTFKSEYEQSRNAHRERGDPPSIEMASVNRGAWRTACIFGGYTAPIEAMEKLGAAISIGDRLRFEPPFSWGMGFFTVQEYAITIAFIDQDNRAHFIYFWEAIGAETQHFEQCVTKPKTIVVF